MEIIEINDQCSIRASFRQPTNKKYDIIINPEMSFGTGHHETTRLMAKVLNILSGNLYWTLVLEQLSFP